MTPAVSRMQIPPGRALVAALVLAVVLGGVLSRSAMRSDAAGICGSPASGVLVCVQPALVSGSIGDPISASVAMRNASDLGAFQFRLDYDPAILSLNSATAAPFLSSTGRSVSCIQSTGSGFIVLACVTQGPEPPAGPSGDGVLADLLFTAVGGGTSSLALANVALTTPAAVVINPPSQDGAVTISGATPTPCAGTCPTSTPSPTKTPLATPPGLASVSLTPLNPAFNIGDIITMSVVATNATNVAAFQFALQLTSGRLELQNAVPGAFLATTGRSIFCPPVQASSGLVTFGCVTQGTGLPGVSGSGTLAVLRFRAIAVGAGTFSFNSFSLANPLSENIVVSSAGTGFVVGSGASATPTPCSGTCPTPTLTPTATPSPTPVPFPATCTIAATVCVQPVSSVAQVGDAITVGVVAHAVSDVGAYQIELTFNPAVLSIQSVANGTFLGSTGRTALCAAPILGAGTLLTACSTLGSVPPPGASGSGVLEVVTFQAFATGVSSIALVAPVVTDPAGAAMSVGTAGGTIAVSNATPTPCAGPCPTSTPTGTPTLTPTPAPISCPLVAATVVCAVPPAQVVASGAPVSFDIIADHVTNLAAYQVEVRYDPTLLSFVSAINGVFLGTTGRSVFCPPVLQTFNSFIVSCASIGASPPGPVGTGILFHVTMQATSNTGISPLTLLQFDLIDPLANPIAAAGASASVEVQ